MGNRDLNRFSREDVAAAKMLAEQGEEAIRAAEESGDLVLQTRAELARAFFLETDEALSRSETLMRSILENAPFGIFTVNRIGQYLDINPMAVELSGYTSEELRNMNISQLLSPEGMDHGLSLFQELSAQESVDGEIEILTKSGERRWWSIKAVTTGDSFTGFCSDITRQKEFEKKLVQSERKHRGFTEAVSDVIWEMDLENHEYC